MPGPDTRQPIARVVLHGRLRKKFGKEFGIAASTVARAIQILCILVPGFRDELNKGQYRVIRGRLKQAVAISEQALQLALPPSGEMHLIPAARGGKNAGPAKIILGVVLVAAAFVIPEVVGPALATSLGATTVLGTQVFAGLALFGASMIIGGISSVIAASMQTPKPLGQSFLLSGALNVTTEGGPVPVVYGRMRVGSVVISVGYEAAAYLGAGQSPGYIAPYSGYSGDLGYFGTGRGGSGKSGSGAGGGGLESPNTLRSNATVRIVDLLSEGPIVGLVDGPRSIFLNDTPLMSPDSDVWNFHGVSWQVFLGYPDQDPLPGFPASEQIIPVGVEALNGTPVVRTIVSSTATAVRLTIEIPALYDLNPTTGDMKQTNLQFTFAIRASKIGVNGFVDVYNEVVSGQLISQKCTSPYEASYRVPLPLTDIGANSWDIMLSKQTINSISTTLQNSLIFQNITIITDHQMMYANSAGIALTFDAKAFNGTIPTRSYLIDGRMIRVPGNYDPLARSYSQSGPGTTGGTWDSFTFNTVLSNNPAWVFYDMITHPRYGASIDDVTMETSRADLYVIGQYADGLVPDGFGGVEPRYTVNAIIADQTDAYILLQTMVSAFRGMTYWGAGQVMVSADMPKNPVKLVNQGNVLNGDFDYQGTSLKTRHNLVRASWRDPGNRYIPAPEPYELTADIASRGEVATDIVAWGCTSRGLAYRWAKWLIYTENNQTEVVQYDASLDHADLRPGDIFEQHDPFYFGLRWGGRVRTGSTSTVIILDSVINPAGATLMTLTVAMPDGSVANEVISPANNIGLLADGSASYLVVFALPAAPLPGAVWILADNALAPRLFQTVAVAQAEPGRFTVNGVGYNPAKFNWIEFNISLLPQVFSKLPDLLLAALAPPSNVTAIDYLIGNGATTIVRLTVSWTQAIDVRVQNYEIQVSNATFLQVYRADGSSIDIDNLTTATYSIAVRSVGRQGQVSVWVSTVDTLVDGKADPPVAPLGMTAIGGTRRVSCNWLPVARRDLKYYEIQRAPDVSGAPGTYASLAYVSATNFLDANSNLLIPNSSWWYRVRAINTTDLLGDFSIEVKATTTFLIVDDLADGIINAAKFAQSIKPVGLMTGTATPGLEGDISFNETDSQLYKFTGGVWVLLIDAGAISGMVADANIAAVSASKITGQLTSAQISDLAAAKLTGTIITTQITDGAISTPKLAAGSVVTASLAAGAVTAATLSVGSATNLIWNACMEQSADGWATGATLALVGGGHTKGGTLDPVWRLPGFGNGYLQSSAILATNGSQVMYYTWDPNLSDPGNPVGVPFPPNTPVEGSAMLLPHRCACFVIIQFYNAAGAFISQLTGTRVAMAIPANGQVLSNYKQSWAHGTSPATCARVRFFVYAFNDAGSDIPAQSAPPYLFFTQCSVGASVPNATQPQPWAPGGVASISGGMLKAISVQSAAIAAGAIQTGHLAAGAVTAGKIAALSITANELAANSIIAGKIAAGAISATEIAAGSIHANLLAADFQLTQSAQIGTAVIGSAQIGNLVVGTSKIANNAVSATSGASGSGSASLPIISDGVSLIVVQFNARVVADPNLNSGQGAINFNIDGALYDQYPFSVRTDSVFPITGFELIGLAAGAHTLSITTSVGTLGVIAQSFTLIATMFKK